MKYWIIIILTFLMFPAISIGHSVENAGHGETGKMETSLHRLLPSASCSQPSALCSLPSALTFTNPLFNGADPWLVKQDGYYYYCYSAFNGIFVSKSKFITRKGEPVMVWKAPGNGWNHANIWAPELHFLHGKWYIYYAAAKKGGSPFIYQRSGVLESKTSDAQGEYIDRGMLNTGNDPNDPEKAVWAIDFTLLNLNGKLYGIWSGWDQNAATDATPQHLYIALMSNPYTLSGSRVKISSPTESWETGGPLNLNEGPEVLKNGGNVFIIYSCRESWLKEYRLGQLRLKSVNSDPLNPSSWLKSGPVFQGTDKVPGTGHCSFVLSPDDTENWIIYHSKITEAPGWKRDVRAQKFTWKADGSPNFGLPVPSGVEIKRPAGEYELDCK